MNSSQTPEPPRTRIGLARPSQALKSPTTLTRSAFGDQTAKRIPGYALELDRVRAEDAVDVPVLALAEQMQVEIAQHRREAIGIVLDMGQTVGIRPIRPGSVRGSRLRLAFPDEEITALDALASARRVRPVGRCSACGRKTRATARPLSSWRPRTSKGSW
jgi:hypothetical protein